MWSVIAKDNFSEFINKYPKLDSIKEDCILLSNDQYFFLPKFTGYLTPFNYIILHSDPTFKPSVKNNLKFIGKLKDEQISMVAPFKNMLQTSNNMCGCLKARPGAGKTVMGVYLACLMKTTCLIIVNNSNLIDQWKDAILNFTNCTEADIGIIGNSKFNVENKIFILGMVQTFCSKIKSNLKEFYNNVKNIGINFVLYDECHHSTSSSKYALSSLVLNTNNIVGLSATPYVSGLADFLMTNTVGPIISDTKNYDLKPKITILKFNSNLASKTIKYISFGTDLLKIRAKYNNAILKSNVYFEVIYSLNSYLLNKGHRILNIVFTKNQVDQISEYLNNQGIENIKYYGEQRNLDKNKDKDLVATYKFAGEGFNYQALSSCIIASPLTGRKSLIQVIGRVLRSYKDKLQPEIFILIDTAINNIFTRDIPKISNILIDEFEIHPNIEEWDNFRAADK